MLSIHIVWTLSETLTQRIIKNIVSCALFKLHPFQSMIFVPSTIGKLWKNIHAPITTCGYALMYVWIYSWPRFYLNTQLFIKWYSHIWLWCLIFKIWNYVSVIIFQESRVEKWNVLVEFESIEYCLVDMHIKICTFKLNQSVKNILKDFKDVNKTT